MMLMSKVGYTQDEFRDSQFPQKIEGRQLDELASFGTSSLKFTLFFL